MSKRALAAFVSWIAMVVASTASATIVNISATANGEETGGVDCAVACEGVLIDPVQVTLGPGDYIITDAYSPATGLEPGALYEAWNFEAGNPQAWAWHWKVLLDDGHDGATISPSNYSSYILYDIDAQDSFTTESAAAAFGAATPPTTLDLTKTTTLDFIVNDYYLPDNAGGVSLNISSTVPEPTSWSMILAAVVALGAVMRVRRRTIVPA